MHVKEFVSKIAGVSYVTHKRLKLFQKLTLKKDTCHTIGGSFSAPPQSKNYKDQIHYSLGHRVQSVPTNHMESCIDPVQKPSG